MISVNVIINRNNEITSINLSGHAEMAEEGKDLVCAGASTCFIGALNALEEPEKATITIHKGLGSIIVKTELSAHDKIVLEVLLTQLKSIEESYSKYLKIKIEKEGAK